VLKEQEEGWVVRVVQEGEEEEPRGGK